MAVDVKKIAAASSKFLHQPKTSVSIRDFVEQYSFAGLCGALVSAQLDDKEREDVLSAISVALDDGMVGPGIVNSPAGVGLIIQGSAGGQMPFEEVRSLAVNQLEKLEKSMLSNDQVLEAAVKCLDDESVGVATRAQAGLRYFATLGDDVVANLLNSPAGSILENLLMGSGEQKKVSMVRSAEAVIYMAEVSTFAHQRMLEKVLVCLHKGLDGKDVLIEMNIIEVLTKAAALPKGLALQNKNGIVEELARTLTKSLQEDASIDSRILAEGILKYTERAGSAATGDIWPLAPLVSITMKIVDSEDSIVRMMKDNAIAAIGGIGSTQQGLRFLVQNFPDTIAAAAKSCLSAQAESKVNSLYCFAALLDGAPTPEEAKQIYGHLDHQVGQNRSVEAFLVDSMKRPFPDLSLAALRVILSIAKQPWGIEDLAIASGFVDSLCTITHDSKKVTDAKVEIAAELVNNPEAHRLFPDGPYARLSSLGRSRTTGVAPRREAQVDIGTMQR